ncbi:alpha/beta fold hydrolase [Dongia soli]|uniref:Alpha/beta hydrolase n=1 Tax=Dongia soli TaxID=600628 RepID=A0ABU5EBZ1_9PROT|nr:alpha/beta fold hydrolase [Dongia soli]MDY0883703.1 alpha/beta hydrolase [Dongia soli]
MILLVHGWGYDATIWDEVADRLAGLPIRRIDLGFFGQVQTELPRETCIGVGHSLGFLWLLRQALPICKALVAVNAFSRFTETADFQPGVAPRLLTRMRQQFERQPAAVLDDFWQRCGAAGPTQPAETSRLSAGLSWLQDWDERDRLAAFDGPLSVIASQADAIVSPAMTMRAFAGEDLLWHESAGHALPRQDPAWLAAQLRQIWDSAGHG